MEGLRQILGFDGASELDQLTQKQIHLRLKDGGLGLRNHDSIRMAAFWSSWADVFPILCKRFPGFENHVRADVTANCIAELNNACMELSRHMELPSWTAILNEAIPVNDEDEDDTLGYKGWQKYTCQQINNHIFASFLSDVDRPTAARILSCGGKHSCRWMLCTPTSAETRFENNIFQCLIRRRLGLPINLDFSECTMRSCTVTVDRYGHHLSTCTRSGRIHGRHTNCIKVWVKILKEAGYTCRIERNLVHTHLACDNRDRRRMDIVANPTSRSVGAFRGLPLFCDVTVVNPLTGQGACRNNGYHRAARTINLAAKNKRRTYRDVVNSGLAKFLVLGNETYGRWHENAIDLIKELAYQKAEEAPEQLRNCARIGWSNRWWNLLSAGVHRSIGEALLRKEGIDLPVITQTDEIVSLETVLED